MRQLTRQLNGWMGCSLAVLIMGCSEPPAEVIIQEESVGLHLPSSIAQMVQPIVPVQSLTPDQSGNTIHIEGTVTRHVPLLAGALYQVQDDSGTVWILTAESPPAESATVSIVGTLQLEPISVDAIDISEIYLQETSRRIVGETARPVPSAPTQDSTIDDNGESAPP